MKNDDLFTTKNIMYAAYLDFASRGLDTVGIVEDDAVTGEFSFGFLNPPLCRERITKFRNDEIVGSLFQFSESHKRMKQILHDKKKRNDY